MTVFDQVHLNLNRAKDNYRSSLRAIDSELRKIVSTDPTQLAGARALQASYGDGFKGADLQAAEHPAGNSAPKKVTRARKAAGAATKAKKK